MDESTAECPACGALVGDGPRCTVCGIELDGADAARLRELSRRLARLDAQVDALAAMRDVVATELLHERLAYGLPTPPLPTARPVPPSPAWSWPSTDGPRPRPEWTADR